MNCRKRVTAIGRLLVAGTVVAFLGQAHAASLVPIYDSTITPLPSHLPSEGGEAYNFNEFGNQVSFAGSERLLQNVVVTMDSWACETGHWYDATCATTPGTGFTWPITLNIYNVGTDGYSVGSLIASVTRSFFIPNRPSTDKVNCTSGKWYSATNAQCYNGLAVNITFDLSASPPTLPNKVIYGIAYDTTHYGYNPVGIGAACYAADGCGYDSLNIALTQDPANVSVGADPIPGTLYQNTALASNYCDSGAAGTGSFRIDSPNPPRCWGVNAPYDAAPWWVPAVRFNVLASPIAPIPASTNGGLAVLAAMLALAGIGAIRRSKSR